MSNMDEDPLDDLNSEHWGVCAVGESIINFCPPTLKVFKKAQSSPRFMRVFRSVRSLFSSFTGAASYARTRSVVAG